MALTKTIWPIRKQLCKIIGHAEHYMDDASGYSPKTRSTSQDLVKLAVSAMDNPVIAEIVSQEEANIPVAGQIYNVNMLLGRNGIVGVKTGNTEEAGGCFMAAAVREIDGQKVTAVSVIMGAPNLSVALRDSVPLVNSVLDNFGRVTLLNAGAEVATYSAPWTSSKVISKKELSGVGWLGKAVTPKTTTRPIKGAIPANTEVGTVSAEFGRNEVESSLLVEKELKVPSVLWRIFPRF